MILVGIRCRAMAFAQKEFGCVHIARQAQDKIHRIPRVVDRTVEIRQEPLTEATAALSDPIPE